MMQKWFPTIFIFTGLLFILESCCSSKCFKEHEGLVGYGIIEEVATSNSFGIIKMHLKDQDHVTGCFLYKYDTSQVDLSRGSSVRFKVKSFMEISLATDIILYDGDIDYTYHQQLLALSDIPHRVNYLHPRFPSHKIGHLQRFNEIKVFEYKSEPYGLGSFTETNGIKVDSIWIPLSFDFNTCPNINAIWVYHNTSKLTFDNKPVILEIDCTHEDFHNKNNN